MIKIFYEFRGQERSSLESSVESFASKYPHIVPVRVEDLPDLATGFLSRTAPAKIPQSAEAYLLRVADQVRIRIYWMESHDVYVHQRFRDWGIYDQLPDDIVPNLGNGQRSMSSRLKYPVIEDGFPSDTLSRSGEIQNNEFILGLLQLGSEGNRPFRVTDYTKAQA